MTSKIRWERLEFSRYFRELADRLGLKDWAIRIDETGPINPKHNACCDCIEGRRSARIDLSDAFLRDAEDQQRRTAVHEVLHLHDAHERHLLAKILSDEQYGMYILAHEYGHDAIAESVALFMPLPSEILDARLIESPEKDHSTA